MKTCFKCLRELPLSEFYRHPQMADGHLKWRELAATDRVRHGAPRASLLGVAASAAPLRLDCGCSPLGAPGAFAIVGAHLFEASIAIGRRVSPRACRALPCEVCGSGNAEAHHDDYGRPLAVRWLCKLHHEAHHHRRTVQC